MGGREAVNRQNDVRVLTAIEGYAHFRKVRPSPWRFCHCLFFLLCLAVLLIARLAEAAPQTDLGEKEQIFPPLPAAEKAVHWKDGYFYLNGEATIIRSGSIHYARVPRELWRDRIWRLKMMGFNCVQSYVFWNAAEPKEGQWNFSDNLDLDAWLSLLKEMGMYALVRVGPYSCAEWEEGGTPAWLTVKPGMIQREMGPSIPYSDAHLAKLEEITAKHQINHGGSVFMVQLENEHSGGWGTQVIDPYLKYLDDQARKNGIEVPIFNSGLHHSHDPAGEAPFSMSSSPWYSTEFWTGWIGKYGDMSPDTLSQKVRGTWKIIAFGGAGYNYYMAHGGTNFGYSGSGEDPGVSYDYSAPVGEAGQLHNLYFPARRAAYFAQTFTPILAGSHDDPALAKSDQPALRVTTRSNPESGSIVFVDHFLRKADVAPLVAIAPDASAYHPPKYDASVSLETHVNVNGLTLPHHGSLKVSSLEPRTIVVNMPWTKSATFESICTNVLFRQTISGINYWVCYGPAGDSGEVTLSRKVASDAPAEFDFTYPADDSIKEIDVDSGDGSKAKLLVMNTDLTNRTWLANGKIYVGPSFVLEDGSMEIPTEGGKATIYSAGGKSEVTQLSASAPALPVLSSWTWRDAAPERAADFTTSGWLQSKGPQPMESYDSFENRYGWYRTTLHRDSAGPVSLRFAGQSGTFAPFLNGQPAPVSTFEYNASGALKMPHAKAGDNSLAILVKASPRPKTTYRGPVGMRLARGLWGGVSADEAPTQLKVVWKKWNAPYRNMSADDVAKPDYDDSTWDVVDPAITDIAKGNAWYRGRFTLSADQVNSMIELPQFGLQKGKKALAITISYLNGHFVEERVQDVSKILHAGENTVLLEIQSRLGGESGELALNLWHNSSLTEANWYFKGGLDDLNETAVIGQVTNWKEFLAHQPWQSSSAPSGPLFWRCTFDYHQPAGLRETIGLLTDGLKAGNVWLNGHNLGESRSPQNYPLYMPECWLKEGDNDLLVFDLYGSSPNQLHLDRFEVHTVVPKS